MDITAADLRRVADGIWSATLGLRLQPGEEPSSSDTVVTGRVEVAGSWCGTVTVACSETLARRAAGEMFGLPGDELPEADVADAIGELANITGGNVKSLSDGSCRLSLPAVTTGAGYGAESATSSSDRRVVLHCDGDAVVVTVADRPAAQRSKHLTGRRS